MLNTECLSGQPMGQPGDSVLSSTRFVGACMELLNLRDLSNSVPEICLSVRCMTPKPLNP